MHRTRSTARRTRNRSRIAHLVFAYISLSLLVSLAIITSIATPLFARTHSHSRQAEDGVLPAPPRTEGEGPFDRLILRGGTLIDGTGSPPFGPVDIVIEKNRIVEVRSVGNPGLPISAGRRPDLVDEHGDEESSGSSDSEANVREIDVSGMYLMPGFVDMHGHIGGKAQGTPSEYVFKLWMGHGITTIRDPACGNGLDWCLDHKRKSVHNEITAPRIEAYVVFGQDHDGPFTLKDEARKWVDEVADRGADGLKFFGYRPDIMQAAIERANERGLRSACHHAQRDVARVNVLDTARWGLTTMEHWYGLPEVLFDDKTIQEYPADYNYNNEQHRFGEAGRLWKQAAAAGSRAWTRTMSELIELDFTIVPTFTIYEASRDLMRERRAEWHDEYTLPSLWDFYRPNRDSHGSYWFYWTTEDEVAWKENYRIWMRFINEYKNRGGRVATGSDSGFIYKLYGFGYVRELELLREAGFHPLEVVRAATLKGAEALGRDHEIGTVEAGKLADLVVVEENPLENFKVLYGTGAIRLDENNVPRRVGGVKYTIKDGIVFDAKGLLADVRDIVQDAKDREGRPYLAQPGHEADAVTESQAVSESPAQAQAVSESQARAHAASETTATDDSRSDDAAAVRTVHDRWVAAAASGDTDTFEAIAADDVAFCPPGEEAIVGRDACGTHLRAVRDALTVRIDIDIEEILVSGDLALDRGTYQQTITSKAGGEPIAESGSYLWIYERVGGEWKIARVHWNALAK